MHKLNGEAAVVANRMTSVVAQAARVKSNGEATGRTRAASVLQCALLATLLAGAAAARADCVDTVGLNAAEQQFLDRAQAALKAQLCPAAAGSGIRWNDGGGAGGVVTTCKGSARKVGDFSPTVSRKFIWPDPQKNRADAVVELVLTVNAPSLPAAEAGGASGSASPQRSAGLAAHNVTWVAKAGGWGLRAQEEQLRAAVLESLDTHRMAALVGRALPTLADSKAAAASAAPFTVGVAAAAAAAAADQTTGTITPAPVAVAAPQEPPASPAARNNAAAVASGAIDRAAGAAQKLKGLFGR